MSNVFQGVPINDAGIINVRDILIDSVTCGTKSTFISPKIIDNPYEPFKSYIYNICGIDPNDVVVECHWCNLFECYDITVTIKNSNLNIYKITVNAKQYDKCKWCVENGQLKIKLYEVINEQPKFELIKGGTN